MNFLIIPGTLRYVHRSCLQQWLNSSKRRSCEICFCPFRVDVKLSYQWWQSIHPWITKSDIRNTILADVQILVFVSLLSLLSMFISIVSLQYERNLPFLSKYEIFWITSSSVIVIICSAILYIIAFVSIISPKVKHWYNWWRSNVTVTLLFDSESDVNVM